MNQSAIKVKFENRVHPNSAFDLLRLERLFSRSGLDHDLEQIQKVEFFLILLITEGQGQHMIDFTEYVIEKGTLLTIRKDQIQRFFKNKNIRGYSLLFTEDFLVSYLEKLESLKALQLFNELLSVPKLQLLGSDYETICSLILRMEHEYTRPMDDYSLGIIRSELHILITKLFRIKSKSSAVIMNKRYLAEFVKFQELVEHNVLKTNRVTDFAAMMALSTKTLNTISKNIINKTAKEFINEIHIKQIKRLLINTSHSIKEIAFMTGFEETTNFYKYFKKHVNATPEAFRTTFR